MDKHLENDAALPDGDSSQKSRKSKCGSSHYLAIDLKSYYASYEAVARNLNPLDCCLVVADASRTENTICLAVSPALKAYGISGRARLFEVVQRVNEINAERRLNAPGRKFTGKSYLASELAIHPEYELTYIIASPRMQEYCEESSRIMGIYGKYVSMEADLFVYSIDEAIMDVTAYLRTYGLTARELAMKMILEVLETTGITATAGIGTNMYLAKIAMDIIAKHVPADENGVRIAELDEQSYRELLWNHRPLTDFWRIGNGYARKLEKYGIMTMGDVARCSVGGENDYYNQELLYRLFGKNTELLIDHAWGWEPCTMADVKAYRPSTNSLTSGQVLQEPYPYEKAEIIVREMTEQLVLDMVEKKLVTGQMTLTIGYDTINLANGAEKEYKGEVVKDHYGREIPKHAHGTANLPEKTSSTRLIVDAMMELYARITDRRLFIRRITVVACGVEPEDKVQKRTEYKQLDLFTDYAAVEEQKKREEEKLQKERRMQEVMIEMRKKFGKNAVLKGSNLQEGSTARARNEQIGGHKKS